jgi:hypothetical protein
MLGLEDKDGKPHFNKAVPGALVLTFYLKRSTLR